MKICINCRSKAILERRPFGRRKNILIYEVKQVSTNANRGKACGTNEISSDDWNNNMSIAFIHVLVNVCFKSGSVPAEWSKGIIIH